MLAWTFQLRQVWLGVLLLENRFLTASAVTVQCTLGEGGEAGAGLTSAALLKTPPSPGFSLSQSAALQRTSWHGQHLIQVTVFFRIESEFSRLVGFEYFDCFMFQVWSTDLCRGDNYACWSSIGFEGWFTRFALHLGGCWRGERSIGACGGWGGKAGQKSGELSENGLNTFGTLFVSYKYPFFRTEPRDSALRLWVPRILKLWTGCCMPPTTIMNPSPNTLASARGSTAWGTWTRRLSGSW